jgi:carbon-monoxide dehydrogenase medium subunit
MFPRSFDYFSPKNLVEALNLLENADADTRILSGGQSLLPAMKMRSASPKKVVDIGNVKELNFIRKDESTLTIGSTITTGTLENDLEISCLMPILKETAAEIADPLVRNLGTIGGNLCFADPANDMPTTMLSINAEFQLASKAGKRTVSADTFFLDAFKTAIKDNEVLTEIEIPFVEGKVGNAFRKIKKGSGGFSIVSVAAQVSVASDNSISGCRLALGAVSPCAFRAQKAEAALVGKVLEASVLDEVAAVAVEASRPISDLSAKKEYRRKVLGILVKEAIELAYKRAVMGNYE